MNSSLRDNILKLDRPVPRYTSYPAAPHFQDIVDKNLYSTWLQDISEDAGLSLYLHVPFCPKMCWYCGCNTKITKRYTPVEDYTHLMMKEIDILANTLGQTRKVTHIHFGGGSPGILRACDFDKIMSKLRAKFQIDKTTNIAIEIDPRELTEGRVAAYAKNGVNRISLGAQDFDDTVLKAVNREQPYYLSYNAVQLLREYGINHINLDLLYGLPHQTIKTMTETIEKALLLKPSRIAFFGYAHVPWMKKHMRLINEDALPDKSLRYDLFETGATELKKSGYKSIGIDHFAKPNDTLVQAANNGTLKRNFQGYTTDTSNILIGIGASSIGKSHNGYVQNSPDMPSYTKSVLAGKLPVKKFYPLTKEDRLRAAIIERLMCDFKANLSKICQDHDYAEDHFTTELAALQPYIDQGFVSIEDNVITINKDAKPIVRIICALFDAHMDHTSTQPRHARAV